MTSKRQAEGDVQFLLHKLLAREEVPPKDKYVVAIVRLIQEERNLDLFFTNVVKIPGMKENQVVIWKALGMIHRLMHFLDQDLFVQLITEHVDSINYLRRLCDGETSLFAKAASILGQLLLMKAEFHRKYTEFAGNMGSQRSATHLFSKYGRELVMRLIELQQLNIACITVVMSLTRAIPASKLSQPLGRNRKNQLLANPLHECMLWPMLNVVIESVTVYESCFQLCLRMHACGEDLTGIQRMFQTQHLKLKDMYGQIRANPYLACKVYTLDLRERVPTFSSTAESPLPPRIKPVETPKGEDQSSPTWSPLTTRKPIQAQAETTPSNHSALGTDSNIPTSSSDLLGFDTGAGNSKDPAKELNDLRQERELLRATVASLEDYIKELTGGLTAVDPDTIASMQLDAIMSTEDQLSHLKGQQLTWQQRYQNAVQEISQLQQMVHDYEAQAEQEAFTASAQAEDLEQQLQQAHVEVDMQLAAIQSLQDMNSDFEKQIQDYETRMTLLQAQVLSLQEEEGQLRRKLVESGEQVEVLRLQQGSASESLQQMKEKHQQVEERASQDRLEVEKMTAELTLVKDQLEAVVKERDLLSHHLAGLKNDLATEETRRSQMEQLLMEAETKVQEATNRVVATTAKEAEARESLKKYQEEHFQAQQELADVNTAMAMLRDEVQQRTQEVEAAKLEVDSVRVEREQAIAQLQEELRERDQKLVTAMTHDQSSAQEVERLQQTVALQRKQIMDLQARCSSLESALETANKQIQDLTAAKQALNNKVQDTEHSLKQAQQQHAEKVKEWETTAQSAETTLSQERNTWGAEKRQLEAEVTKLTSQLDGFRTEQRTSSQRAKDLEQNLDSLQRELREARNGHAVELEQARRQHATALREAEDRVAQVMADASQERIEQEAKFAAGVLDSIVAALDSNSASPMELLSKVSTEVKEMAQNTPLPSRTFESGPVSPTVKSESAWRTTKATNDMLRAVRLGSYINQACTQLRKIAESEGVSDTHPVYHRCNVAMQTFQQTLYALCNGHSEATNESLTRLATNVDSLLDSSNELARIHDALENTLEQQMADASTMIDDAAERIELLIRDTEASLKEGTLKVNESILDQSRKLMSYIKQLIATSSELQQEIVSTETNQGKRSSVLQFYKRNSRWVDGLVSAAKAVGAAATVLVDTADRTVSGAGKLEEIMVCGQEISASTAQLVSASRVKARPHSNKKAELESCSKDVHTATQSLIEAVRDACQKAREVQSAQDYLKLTVTQARRLQMDSQVRVKELEYELLQEQERLRQLRKAHYHLSDTSSMSPSPRKLSTAQ
eukprot:m.229607 g.229607  ORF g.229607 m.229607 type:complete len:1309 (-) comp17055_c2_seq1:125-4051(-)